MSSRNIKNRKTKVDTSRLTGMQLAFAHAYVGDKNQNGAAAAREAGFKNPAVAASKLLKEGHPVSKYISKMLGDRLQKYDLSAENILKHLATAMYLDPISMFQSIGNGVFVVKSLEEVPEDVRRCITKMKCRTKTVRDEEGNSQGEETYIELEFMSKDAALALAMKYRNLVGGDTTVNNTVIASDTLIAQMLKKNEESRNNVIDTKLIESKVVK